MDAISLGIDFFDASYPTKLTEMHLAAQYPVDPLQPPVQFTPVTQNIFEEDQKCKEKNVDGLHLALGLRMFALDTRPLLENCLCHACKYHTRAYIHHLIRTHEMTGLVLLQLHNLHHYNLFFNQIRESIASASFADYASQMKPYFAKDDI